MVNLTFRTQTGDTVEVAAEVGTTLMEAAVQEGVEGIDAECGGACSCATCHVIFDDRGYALVGAANSLEAEMLEFAENTCETSRLACQVKISEDLDGLVIEVGEC